jgi:hypothetical protein
MADCKELKPDQNGTKGDLRLGDVDIRTQKSLTKANIPDVPGALPLAFPECSGQWEIGTAVF